MSATPAKPPQDNTNKLIVGTLVGLVAVGLLVWAVYAARSRIEKPPSWDQHDAEMRVLDENLKALTSQIKAQQGTSTCSADSDCRVVGLGVKTCGGFNDWLVYSIADVKEEELLATVSDFNKKFERFMSLSLKVPPCGGQPKQIRCVKKHCEPI